MSGRYVAGRRCRWRRGEGGRGRGGGRGREGGYMIGKDKWRRREREKQSSVDEVDDQWVCEGVKCRREEREKKKEREREKKENRNKKNS